MRTTPYASALLALALLGAGCNDALAPTPGGPSSTRDVDVDDPRGELIVEVRYAGNLRSNASPIADNDCQILVNVGIPNWSGNAIGFCEGTRTALTSPGTFGSNAWIYDGYTYPTLTGNIPVVVTAGQTTRQVYELADHTGIVSGLVTIDGHPAKSPYTVCLSTGGCSYFPANDGRFSLLTKPGAGTGVIRNNTGNQLATFSYTATLGQTVAVPDVATSDPRGTLTAEVRYGGDFFSNASPVADNDCQILVNVGVPSWSGNAIGFCEKTRTTTVVPGTYGSNIWIYDGYTYPSLTGNIPVTVVNAQTTTQVYELATITGIVSGRVLVDGVPATSPVRVCLSTGGCSYFQRGGGNFVLMTKPGSGTGVVLNSQGGQLGSFTYSVSAGETITVPDVQASDPRGTLTVEVRYNGAFHNNASPIADNDCQFLTNVGVPSWSGNAIGFCERTRTTTVTPGTYGSNIWIYDGYTYPGLTGNIPVVVTNGQTTTQVYDLAPITAIVSGRVMVNGQPATSPYRVCLSSGGCSYFPHADGRFRLLTKPGVCTGGVWNNLGVRLATFNCGSEAGEDKDVGTIGGDVTAPEIDATVTGTLGAGGWYTSNVGVTWSVTDGQSAVDEQTGCGPSSLTSDVAAVTYTCSARSSGGPATKSVTVKRDASRPTVTAAVSGTEGSNGWYRSAVGVAWTVAANGPSGENHSCAATTLAGDTPAATFLCTATSGAGLATSSSVTVKKDGTAPVIAFSGASLSYGVDQVVNISCSASDALSGIASSTCPQVSRPAYELAIGLNTLSASAVDNAGNAASATASFSVTVTPAGLCALVQRFVDKPGVAHSMCVKLDGARPALNAFMNEVRAQAGKSVSSQNAALLVRLAGEM